MVMMQTSTLLVLMELLIWLLEAGTDGVTIDHRVPITDSTGGTDTNTTYDLTQTSFWYY